MLGATLFLLYCTCVSSFDFKNDGVIKRVENVAKDVKSVIDFGENVLEHKVGDPIKEWGVKLDSHFCSCQGYMCKCCVDLATQVLYLNDTLCVDVGLVPEDYGVKIALTWDGKEVISEELSGKNPPPICAQVPIPKLKKLLSICVRMHDLSISRHNFDGCIGIEFDLLWKKLFNVEMGCFHLGHKPQTWMCAYPHDSQEALSDIPLCLNTCNKSIGYYNTLIYKTQDEGVKTNENYVKRSCHYTMTSNTEEGSENTEPCLLGCTPHGYLD